MKPKLKQTLNTNDASVLEAEYKSCPTFRERLVAIFEEEIQQSLSEMRDVATKGNVPCLASYYADELAKQRALEWAKTFLK